MSRQNLAERTAAIAAQARSAAHAGGGTKAGSLDEPIGSGFPARAWWTVHNAGADPLTVFVHPPLTQPQVREHFYPNASGIVPFHA